MARLPRLIVPGAAQALILEGIGTDAVFRSEADWSAATTDLKTCLREAGVLLHAWALLPRFILLLVSSPQASSVSRALQAFGRRFGAAYNRRYQRHGPLWVGRYRSTSVCGSAAELEVMHWIEASCVAWGGATAVADWRWSSYAHHIGLQGDSAISDLPAYWQLGNTPFERQAAWRALFDEALVPARSQQIEYAIRHGWLLGVASGSYEDRPTQPRRPGRPKKTGPN